MGGRKKGQGVRKKNNIIKFLPNKMASEFFKSLNKKPTSPFKKVSDLTINKKYSITNAEIKDTKFGKSVQLTVDEDEEEIKFFLPRRYSKTKRSELKYFINNYIVYKGREDKMDIIKFKENKEKEISSESEE